MEYSAIFAIGAEPFGPVSTIDSCAVQQAQALAAQGLTQRAWEVLAAAGDSYASGAAAVLNTDPNQSMGGVFYHSVAIGSWISAGASLEQFDGVAAQHLQQYLELLNSGGGVPPSTAQIEQSYTKALGDHGLTALAAIDNSLWAPVWSTLMWMEPLRWSVNPDDTIPWLVNLLQVVNTAMFGGTIFTYTMLFERRYQSSEIAAIDPRVHACFASARSAAPTPVRRDPLILDLDGDGLETIGINTSAPVLFDHDGDGVKTATGWVKPDDAFLVLDRNGNGVIDDGTELFGDATNLDTGGKAADGFAALAQEDTNGDGKVDNLDARWSDLRLWKDVNQDGVSQADELFTLESQGVAGLTVAKTENSALLSNGNQIADLGGFVRTDGSTGAMGVTGQMADIDLAENTFYRQFTDTIQLTETTKSLAEINGTGEVRDLREAATLSPELASELAGLSGYHTRSEVRGKVDSVIAKWGETSSMPGSIDLARIHGFNLYFMVPGQTREEILGRTDTITVEEALARQNRKEQQVEITLLIEKLERFNGLTFVDVSDAGARTGAGTLLAVSENTTVDAEGLASTTHDVFVSLTAEQINLLKQSYQQLWQSVYDALTMQTRIKSYLDDVGLVLDENGVRLDFTALDTRLATWRATDPKNALVDLLELNQYVGDDLRQQGWEGWRQSSQWVGDPGMAEVVQAVAAEFGGAHSGAFTGSELKDVLFGASTADVLQGANGDDLLFGLSGDDVLYGGAGADAVSGGAGNDTLYTGAYDRTYNRLDGGEGDDVLRVEAESGAILVGGAGNDQLLTDYWTYSDTFEGGTGNDLLRGGHSADTYLFNLGDGQDTIDDNQWYAQAGVVDRLVFGGGIVKEDLSLKREGNDLIFVHANGTDSVRVKNWFVGGQYRVEEVSFADGSKWGQAEIQAMNVQVLGTAGNDVITGSSARDWVEGGAGNDTLYTGAYDRTYNRLDGGEGDDVLRVEAESGAILVGGAGNDQLLTDYWTYSDTFEGGMGNDLLRGGHSADTYLFNLGDGQDTIDDNQWYAQAGVVDRLVFGAGIKKEEIGLQRDGSDMVFLHANGSDSVRVKNWFSGAQYQVERIEFGDGAVWTPATTSSMELLLRGTSANDTISGGAGRERIEGGGGSDTLNGGTGNDVLDGGAGNDVLTGDAGVDTYVLARDYGTDRINGSRAEDVLRVKAATGDVYFERTGVNLDVLVRDANGVEVGRAVLVDQFSSANSAGVDQIVVDDEVILTASGLGGRVLTNYTDTSESITGSSSTTNILNAAGGNDLVFGGAESDLIKGGAGADAVYGGEGADLLEGLADDDTLYGEVGNDLLCGGQGADTLSGGLDNDVLIGGTGADVLAGGDGTNVFLINKGDGADVVTAGGAGNTLSLGGGISYSDLTLTRSDNDLVLATGATDSVTFKDWYLAPENRAVTTLQFIADAMTDFVAGGADPLKDQAVETLDFMGLVSAFDAQTASTPGLSNWAVNDALTYFGIAGSDSAALGGDLAYQYGKTGSLTGVGLSSAQDVLAALQLGETAQALRPFAGLRTSSVALS